MNLNFDNYLRRVKIKLKLTDTSKDELLLVFIEDYHYALLSILGEAVIPPQFQWIVEELAIKRYRTIGSENLTSETVKDLKNDFEANPFAPYEAIITDYKDRKDKIVRFI